MKIAIFADTNNLYQAVGARYSSKLSYNKYYNWCKDLGEVLAAFAFVAQVKTESKPFITCLKKFGFDTKTKRIETTENTLTTWDLEMSLDCLRYVLENGDVDTVIIGSNSLELVPLLKQMLSINVKPIIIASKIPSELKRYAFKWIEIPKSLTEDAQEIMERKAEYEAMKEALANAAPSDAQV